MELFLSAGLVFLIMIIYLYIKKTESEPSYRYKPKMHIMTRAEADLFRKLEKEFGSEYCIFPQVHLSSLVSGRIRGQNWEGAFRHINGKSVDFVLVDKTTLQTICAIECDDYTHERKDRIERDKEVDRIFESVGVPLVRIHASLKKTSTTIKKEVKMYIDI